jgi:hypothetical protein
MSNTPETDKNAWSDSSEGIFNEVVSSDFARKLERERDEARNELKQWQTLRLYGAEPEYIHEYIRMLRYNC